MAEVPDGAADEGTGVTFGDWLDERVGWRALLRGALEEPVPGGAKWSYVFGSCLTFVLMLQAATGIVMASYYSPSTTDAWASVAYLQDQVTLGWFLRGLHSTGASAMMILLDLHLLQVAIWGAYRKPREMNWILGVLMLGLTFAFALTGYLLPWDQKGYWATQVVTSIAGATPLIGKWIQRTLQGGEAYGNLTLTRFYALHVLALPALMALLVTAHIALFRRHGVTPSWRGDLSRVDPFWPDQLLRDVTAMAVVLAAMVAWTVAHHGAELEAPADPSSSYDARPEWYFLPLFQLLKIVPTWAELPAAMGAPLVAVGILLALPWLDRAAARDPRSRRNVLALIGVIFVGALGLGVQARVDDAGDEKFRVQREKADRDATRARALALEGVPAAGGVAVWENDPDFKARRLLARRCLGCHLFDGEGERKGPDLDGWSSRAWIAGLLRDPEGEKYYGKTKIRGMKPVKGSDEQIAALTEFVFAQGGGAKGSIDETLRAQGEQLFSEMDCDTCHPTDGTGDDQGPNLGRRATAEWLRDFLRDPSEPRFFGKKNEMPRFREKLSADELESLVTLLLRGRS